MDAIELSRIQFGCTAAFHFLFVPLTLGLIVLCVLMESIHLLTGDKHWQGAAQFWGKFFVINFICGVATGYPLRLQLQANWELYSGYVQHVFQAIFSLEGLIAPFLFGFVLVFTFGWRLRPVVHWMGSIALAILMVVQASSILTLNAWMQHPVGVEFVGGQAQLLSLSALFDNPLLWPKVIHTVAAGHVLGCVFVIAISAWYLLRGRHVEIVRRSLRLAAGYGVVAVIATAAMGHLSGQLLAEYQPMKFAAIEGLWETEPAPAPLTLFAWPDAKTGTNRFALRVPKVLGWLAGRDGGQIAGIHDLVDQAEKRIAASVRDGQLHPSAGERLSIDQYAQRYGFAALLPVGMPVTDERIAQAARATVPAVPALFWAFRIMAGCGVFLLGLFAYLAWHLERGDGVGRRGLWLCLFSLPLPWIAIEAGWMVCELGRQPWTITGVLPTAVSAGFLVAAQVRSSLAAFAVGYALLLAANVALTMFIIRRGPGAPSILRWRDCSAPRGTQFDDCIGRASCTGCAFHSGSRSH